MRSDACYSLGIKTHFCQGPLSCELNSHWYVFGGWFNGMASHLDSDSSNPGWMGVLLPCYPVRQPIFQEISLMEESVAGWIAGLSL